MVKQKSKDFGKSGFDKSCFGKKDFGKKGFVFILDSVIALILVVAVISISGFMISKSNNAESTTGVVAGDILAALDNSGRLALLDNSTIVSNLNSFVPSKYDWKISVDCKNSAGINYGGLSSKKDVFVAERFFATDSDYCLARLYLWLK
ncbi:MAG: hypothetical protein Q8O89_08630 [Nanoarchaeota archaeon]|nr:hypothetical protein [Nanoarchaeota archaeon]